MRWLARTIGILVAIAALVLCAGLAFAKIEIFQAIWHGVHPGQRWRFSIRVKGKLTRSYVIVGMEWFSVFKHVVGKVVGYGYNYIAEQDVYPQVNGSWQRVTAVSPRLPGNARCVAVYVQLPEINGTSRIDVQVSGASLILSAPGTGAPTGRSS